MVQFSGRVKVLRHRLSQVEMRIGLGSNRGHISEMETGKKNVCLPLLEVLAKGFSLIVASGLRRIGTNLP